MQAITDYYRKSLGAHFTGGTSFNLLAPPDLKPPTEAEKRLWSILRARKIRIKKETKRSNKNYNIKLGICLSLMAIPCLLFVAWFLPAFPFGIVIGLVAAVIYEDKRKYNY